MYPRRSYIIYAPQRSGSSLLCEALRATGVAGRPGEYFTSPHAQGYSRRWNIPLCDGTDHLGENYFQRIYDTATPNGMFGVKLLWQEFSYCIEQIRKLEGNEHLSIPELLSKAFPHHQSIWITRDDKVRQAISWWRAAKTSIWRKPKGVPGRESNQHLDFDFHQVDISYQKLVKSEAQMQTYFYIFGIEPLHVVYEDFIDAYEETTLKILDYLHLSPPKNLTLGEPKLQKQADEQTEKWVQQYYQMKQEQEKVIPVAL